VTITGGLAPGTDRANALLKSRQRPSRQLFASGGNEPVADGGAGEHSIFAGAFLRALQTMEPAEFLVEEIFPEVRERVGGRSSQLPELDPIRNSGHDGGSFVFSRIATAAPITARVGSAANSSDPAVALASGIGPFRFGMKPEEANRLFTLPFGNVVWATLPMAGEYQGAEMHYYMVPVQRLPAPAAPASPFQPLSAFQDCWTGQSKVLFFFTKEDGLVRISARFQSDCAGRSGMLAAWASAFGVPAAGTSRHLAFRRALPGVILEGHKLRALTFVEIFRTGSPEPVDSWWSD